MRRRATRSLGKRGARAGCGKRADEALADDAAERSAAQAAAAVLALVTALWRTTAVPAVTPSGSGMFTDMLAEEFRLPEEERDRLRWAALLHDIGKLDGARRGLLNKPGTARRRRVGRR